MYMYNVSALRRHNIAPSKAVVGVDRPMQAIFMHIQKPYTRPHRAVGNVSGNRCESDCRSRGPEFDPWPVSRFHGD